MFPTSFLQQDLSIFQSKLVVKYLKFYCLDSTKQDSKFYVKILSVYLILHHYRISLILITVQGEKNVILAKNQPMQLHRFRKYLVLPLLLLLLQLKCYTSDSANCVAKIVICQKLHTNLTSDDSISYILAKLMLDQRSLIFTSFIHTCVIKVIKLTLALFYNIKISTKFEISLQ